MIKISFEVAVRLTTDRLAVGMTLAWGSRIRRLK